MAQIILGKVKGDKGDKGEQGLQGIQGIQGEPSSVNDIAAVEGNITLTAANILNGATSVAEQINSLDALKVTPHLADLVTDADGAHGLKIESGTFTPVLKGATTAGTNTYIIQSGTYYKIGKLIYTIISLRLTAKDATMAGYLSISGLPFSGSANGVTIGRHAYITYDGILTGRIENAALLLDVAKTVVINTNLMPAAIANNSEIFISAIYKEA